MLERVFGREATAIFPDRHYQFRQCAWSAIFLVQRGPLNCFTFIKAWLARTLNPFTFFPYHSLLPASTCTHSHMLFHSLIFARLGS